ncbi:conserved hypothetical protein [Neospora caninum Liverpool]|uniref:Uncharacterized protein n=1 Tax=Neospora caninum (strain Liverpool) TaxID=572307 RepID=F0VK35_NEOCL|nr:conserved hypothetical protein [Neospora caninum Liverpool]CBZ54436.1 conserved hypothetical protein [Neospora caninum Liverpool]CEL69145.1 TPA: hypothetical protein BN1204_048650 [Neospora caninum Liverpool]|eukprot:XP_003884466.1 conserved hypothetical protein [Neospora caninum Liverpool]
MGKSRRQLTFFWALLGVGLCAALFEGSPGGSESASRPSLTSARDISVFSSSQQTRLQARAQDSGVEPFFSLTFAAAEEVAGIGEQATAELDGGHEREAEDTSVNASVDEFADVVVEEDPFAEGNEDALESLLSGFRSQKGKGEADGQAASGDTGRTSESEAKDVDREDGEEDFFEEVPVEGESGRDFFVGPKKNSWLEKVKRFAKGHMMQQPDTAQIKLPLKDTLQEKALKASQEKEKRRQKRRKKLAIERHKEDQKEKFDSSVELAEKEAENKKINKMWQKIVTMFENRF